MIKDDELGTTDPGVSPGDAGATRDATVRVQLRARLRADDVPARYGGDETVVLLPDTTLEGARVVGEKLRVAVRELRVAYGGRTLPPVSISVGVGAYPASGYDADALLKAVDVALYRAKGAIASRWPRPSIEGGALEGRPGDPAERRRQTYACSM